MIIMVLSQINTIKRRKQQNINYTHTHTHTHTHTEYTHTNLAADSAAKDALDGEISVELIPFSDLKSRTNKYILELWQSEWGEFPEN